MIQECNQNNIKIRKKAFALSVTRILDCLFLLVATSREIHFRFTIASPGKLEYLIAFDKKLQKFK